MNKAEGWGSAGLSDVALSHNLRKHKPAYCTHSILNYLQPHTALSAIRFVRVFHLQVHTQYLLKFKFHCYIACGSPLKNISSFQWSYNLGIRCLQMIWSLQKSYSKYSPLYKLWKHWSPHQIHKNVAAHLDLRFFVGEQVIGMLYAQMDTYHK